MYINVSYLSYQVFGIPTATNILKRSVYNFCTQSKKTEFTFKFTEPLDVGISLIPRSGFHSIFITSFLFTLNVPL